MAKEPTEYAVASISDFPAGTHRIVKAGSREIGVFNIGGRFYALPNRCPHQLGPLCKGKTSGTLIANQNTGWRPEWVHEGEIVTCPWHGLEYHVPTGQCLAFPEIQLRAYEVWVEGDTVKVRF